MADKKQHNENSTDRRPDCVTEIRMGNTVLVVSGVVFLFLAGALGLGPVPN